MSGVGRFEAERVRRALERCQALEREQRYAEALEEAERILPDVGGAVRHGAELLLCAARSAYALGRLAEAAAKAEAALHLMPNPGAFFVAAAALQELHRYGRAEELLRRAVRLFGEDPVLWLQLVSVLVEKGDLAGAAGILEELPPQAFDALDRPALLAIAASLFERVGNPGRALEILDAAEARFPGDPGLSQMRREIRIRDGAMQRLAELAARLEAGLEPLEGAAAAVDRAVNDVAIILGEPPVAALAARRLWRDFLAVTPVRPRAHRAWGLALLEAVARLDDRPFPLSVAAMFAKANAATVRSALRRLLEYLGRLDPRIARRRYAALTNPVLEELPEEGDAPAGGEDGVVPFPGPRKGDDR